MYFTYLEKKNICKIEEALCRTEYPKVKTTQEQWKSQETNGDKAEHANNPALNEDYGLRPG